MKEKMVCGTCLGNKTNQLSWHQGEYMSCNIKCSACNGKGFGSKNDITEKQALGSRQIRALDDYLARGGKWD